MVLPTVVLAGNVTPIAVYVAFHVIARAVPLSYKRKIKRFPSTGVPIGAAIVKGAACAVKLYWSYAEMSGVKVDVDVVDETLGSIRLFVRVVAPAKVATVPLVGKVTLVAPDNVMAKLYAPLIVIVLAALLATPVPPLVAGSVPVTPVERGRPVTLVATKAAGVPRPIALPEASRLTDFAEG